MNKKAFLWGLVVGAILCILYVEMQSFIYVAPHAPTPEELRQLETVRQNYIRGMTQPLQPPQP